MKGLIGRPEFVSHQNASSDTLALSPPVGGVGKVSDNGAQMHTSFATQILQECKANGEELQMKLQ